MEKLIEIKNLSKHFPIKKGFFNKTVGNIYAVNNISFDIYKGETLGLVGESGCGKSTTGRCVLKLINATEGQIIFKGKDISNIKAKELKDIRSKMQIIFQNPQSSLNPRMTVKDTLSEPLIINTKLSKQEITKRIDELVELVGLSKGCLNNFPHEFSGGQRQRIGIARALAINPEFIVADEPVSALDVSIQAQIINLLEDLKQELKLTYLFISHDLSVVRHFCDRVAVMYLGEIAEIATTDQLFNDPCHPYTKALLSAIPEPKPGKDHSQRVLLAGDLPSPANPPSGCKFNTRCPEVMPVCKTTCPPEFVVEHGHTVCCHLFSKQ